jgi:hypothetical protein
MNFCAIPLREDFLVKIRKYGLDDQNQPVERHIAAGGEPCRDVLRRARPGEELILASYCPFSLPGPYKEYGPVFALAAETGAAGMPGPQPWTSEIGMEYLGERFVLRAYDERERIIDAELSAPSSLRQDLARMLGRKEAAFVLARYATYGCYALRIEANH